MNIKRYPLLVILIIAVVLLSYYASTRPLAFFERETGIKLPLTAKPIINSKNKGSFGDGTLLMVYKLDELQMNKLIKDNYKRFSGWGPMPMEPKVFIALYQKFSGIMDENELKAMNLGAKKGYILIRDKNANGFSMDNMETEISTNLEIILVDLSLNRVLYFTLDT